MTFLQQNGTGSGHSMTSVLIYFILNNPWQPHYPQFTNKEAEEQEC